MDLNEARLFRLLTSFFGEDRVFFRMGVLTVCGGSLPVANTIESAELNSWAKRTTCLFTIVDPDDNPKMVVEFFSGFEKSIDPVEEEHQRLLGPLLEAAGVFYVTMTPEDLYDILDPDSTINLCSFLQHKVDEFPSFLE